MTVQPTRDQLRALADAATPGPWVVKTCEPCAKHGREDIQIWNERGHIPIAQWMDEVDPDAGDDAAFIAAARTAVPQLLDQLDQAEAERDRWHSMWRQRGVKHLAAEKRATRAEAQVSEEKRLRMKATAAATAAEAERDEWRQTALDERAAALDQMEQVRIRDARIAAVDAELIYAEIHGNLEVWTHNIRRALEGGKP